MRDLRNCLKRNDPHVVAKMEVVVDWRKDKEMHVHLNLHLGSQREPELVHAIGVDFQPHWKTRVVVPKELMRTLSVISGGGCNAPLKRVLHWAEEHLRGLGVRLVSHPLECKG